MNRKRIKNGRSLRATWLGRSRGICPASDAFRSAKHNFGAPAGASVRLENGRSHQREPAARWSVVGFVSGMRIHRKYKTHKA